jgi:hypothetical protein
MDEKTLRLLVENGAIKQVHIIGKGGLLHVEAVTPTGKHTATTLKGKLKTWTNLNSVAKWVRTLGVGTIQLNIEQWQPDQKVILLKNG